MKKINIFYFSGTGNTWWISNQIAEQLSEMGMAAKTFSIEQISEPQLIALVSEADMIGLGFPIYGSDAPHIFLDFIDRLPDLINQKETLGFVTQMAWSGDGSNFLKKDILTKGYSLKWAAEFIMPNNVALPILPLPYSSDYAKIGRALKKNKEKVHHLCEKIAAGESYRQHADWISKATAWIQRGPFRLGHDWGRKFWSVDAEACISCERCARLCPVENIVMADELPVYADKCVYCMRCFNYCPTLAIHYAGMSNKRVKKKFPYQGPVKAFRPEMLIRKG